MFGREKMSCFENTQTTTGVAYAHKKITTPDFERAALPEEVRAGLMDRRDEFYTTIAWGIWCIYQDPPEKGEEGDKCAFDALREALDDELNLLYLKGDHPVVEDMFVPQIAQLLRKFVAKYLETNFEAMCSFDWDLKNHHNILSLFKIYDREFPSWESTRQTTNGQQPPPPPPAHADAYEVGMARLKAAAISTILKQNPDLEGPDADVSRLEVSILSEVIGAFITVYDVVAESAVKKNSKKSTKRKPVLDGFVTMRYQCGPERSDWNPWPIGSEDETSDPTYVETFHPRIRFLLAQTPHGGSYSLQWNTAAETKDFSDPVEDTLDGLPITAKSVRDAQMAIEKKVRIVGGSTPLREIQRPVFSKRAQMLALQGFVCTQPSLRKKTDKNNIQHLEKERLNIWSEQLQAEPGVQDSGPVATHDYHPPPRRFDLRTNDVRSNAWDPNVLTGARNRELKARYNLYVKLHRTNSGNAHAKKKDWSGGEGTSRNACSLRWKVGTCLIIKNALPIKQLKRPWPLGSAGYK